MQEWAGRSRDDAGYREEYLRELIRLEGRGGPQCHSCMSCSSELGLYRCDDCLGPLAECVSCCLKRHRHLPLHIIKVSVFVAAQSSGLTFLEMERRLLRQDVTQRSRPLGSAGPSSEQTMRTSSTGSQGFHRHPHEWSTLRRS